MKSTRKKRLAIVLIPALFICASAFGFGAYAAAEEPSPLNKGALFTEAERDLDALSDLSGSKHITVRDGQDVEIGGAGIWIIDGMASDVTVSVDAPEDAVVYLLLKNLRIENRDRPCIYVGSAGKVYLIPTGGSKLTVSKAFRKDHDRKANAVIYSCTDLTLRGEAPLIINSSKNGIVCRDKLRFLGGEYVITAGSKAVAADNAIWIAGGDFRIKAETDGFHAENKDDMQGSIYIGGGSFDIDVADDAVHGQTMVQIDDGRLSIAADEGIESTRVLINGGELDIRATGDGINAGKKSDAYRPKIEITGGSVTVTMDGKDPDAIDSNADLVISGGTVSVSGAGIDWDGELDFTGGTVIIEGETVSEIPNANTNKPDETGAKRKK